MASLSLALTVPSQKQWEVNAAGKETILHTFGKTVYVYAGLIIDSDGNLYGVTDSGGPANLGGVYKLTLEK